MTRIPPLANARRFGFAFGCLLAFGLLAGCTDPPPNITFNVISVESTSRPAGPGVEDQVAFNVTLEVVNGGSLPYRMDFDDWTFEMDADGEVKFSGFHCLTALGASEVPAGTSTTWEFFLFLLGTTDGNLTAMAFRDDPPQQLDSHL